jgi:hypothetical protein
MQMAPGILGPRAEGRKRTLPERAPTRSRGPDKRRLLKYLTAITDRLENLSEFQETTWSKLMTMTRSTRA